MPIKCKFLLYSNLYPLIILSWRYSRSDTLKHIVKMEYDCFTLRFSHCKEDNSISMGGAIRKVWSIRSSRRFVSNWNFQLCLYHFFKFFTCMCVSLTVCHMGTSAYGERGIPQIPRSWGIVWLFIVWLWCWCLYSGLQRQKNNSELWIYLFSLMSLPLLSSVVLGYRHFLTCEKENGRAVILKASIKKLLKTHIL